MLIDFTLTNFRSYQEPTTFSLESGGGVQEWQRENTVSLTADLRVLKCATIFGANGAGKSAVLAGLARMRQMVTVPTEQITDELPYEPFQFDTESATQRTTFTVNFVRNQQIYRYAFSYTATRVIDEVLSVAQGDQYQVLFARENGDVTVVPAGLAVIAQRVRPNALMLAALQQWNYQPAIEVFEWFSQDLVILGEWPSGDCLDDDWIQTQLVSLLRVLGSEVANVVQRRVAIQFLDGSAVTRPDLYLVYEKYDEEDAVRGYQELPLTSASVGMQQLVSISLALIVAQHAQHPRTILVDDRLTAVHPTVVAALLGLINSEANQNQVVLTTNQPMLMSQQLRVDQVYLAEKNYRGVSQLTALLDFEGVATSGWLADYLTGQFGAMPTVNVSDLLTIFKAKS
ncbi:AAA family ATPase [Levilactobacillus tujiorum]|uniref:AAA family ATPase n=1 Tax=Levilactobacillus tujiorum TaxID=2912243 RepID=UPI0014577659|nr:ATP-binding protein [Levilactobacillus tujiorum]NLR32533.1 ATP-binding protein [Levilactobacillus tujiorum]